MKKVLFIFTLILFFKTGHAQSNHELRLNLFNMLLGSVDLQYERLLKNNSGLGATLGIGYNTRNNDVLYRSIVSINPEYKVYLGGSRHKGFFVEANSRLSLDQGESEREVNFGLGVAMGGKVISNNGNFAATFYGGVGRFLTENTAMDTQFYPNLGVTLGRRF